MVSVKRLGNGPIIRPDMDARMGDNVNGPALIKVPDWVPGALGRYYLYFGHHDGRYIRMAYADELTGPWHTHEAGVLALDESLFRGHIASPDVCVDADSGQIRMYFHGADFASVTGKTDQQHTRVAVSTDGLSFQTREPFLARSYLRVIRHGEGWLGMAMPGLLYRSASGLDDFEPGPSLFDRNMRHCALLSRGERLLVFYTQVGDVPERLLLSEVAMAGDWTQWRSTPPVVVLEPERDYEGVKAPLEPSTRGLVMESVRQLRDPAIFVEDDRTYLLYSVAGEKGIALARIELD